jgi:hypothetical protein
MSESEIRVGARWVDEASDFTSFNPGYDPAPRLDIGRRLEFYRTNREHMCYVPENEPTAPHEK